MRSFLECIPCFLSQAIKTVKFVTDDTRIHERVMREVLRMAGGMDLSVTPPQMGQLIHRTIREYTGNDDPYLEIKKRSNELALSIYPQVRALIENSADPFKTAVQAAIAGNIIDFATKHDIDDELILGILDDSSTELLASSDVSNFRQAIEQAGDILYLGDNAGEIVFDRLLLERMPRGKITFAVRGSPVINDATCADAQTAGITELVEVIDNGSDAPGTVLESCSESFRKRFEQADLIIAKGQGNYETLSDVDRDIFFLFKVKCPVIGRHAGRELGSLVLDRSRQTSNTK